MHIKPKCVVRGHTGGIFTGTRLKMTRCLLLICVTTVRILKKKEICISFLSNMYNRK